jgi:hypothetical protein
MEGAWDSLPSHWRNVDIHVEDVRTFRGKRNLRAILAAARTLQQAAAGLLTDTWQVPEGYGTLESGQASPRRRSCTGARGFTMVCASMSTPNSSRVASVPLASVRAPRARAATVRRSAELEAGAHPEALRPRVTGGGASSLPQLGHDRARAHRACAL